MIKIFLKNLLLLITSLIVSVILIELILYKIGIYNNLSRNKLVASDAIYERPASSILNNLHPDLKIIIRNQYDENGIRSYKNQNTAKLNNIIAFFGDSMTENINIKDELVFINILNDTYKKENIKFINFGVGGYSIDQVFIRYLKYKTLDIKDVYYVFCSNDNTNNGIINFNNKNEYFINKKEINYFFQLIGKLNITYLMIDSFYHARTIFSNKYSNIDKKNYSKILANKFNSIIYKNLNTKNYQENEKIFFNKTLKAFQDEVLKDGRRFFIIILPSKIENESFTGLIIGDEKKYNIINLYKLSSKYDSKYNNLIFKNDTHYNEWGNLYIAGMLQKEFDKIYRLNTNLNKNFIIKKINNLYRVKDVN
jgi:hypothetical protein